MELDFILANFFQFQIFIGVKISSGKKDSSVHANNKNKDILILGNGETKRLDNTSLTVEAEYSINFSRPEIKFCLSLHYNGSNSLFFNTTKIHQFKAKDSEIKRYHLCSGNISKVFSMNNMKKPGLNGYVYNNDCS